MRKRIGKIGLTVIMAAALAAGCGAPAQEDKAGGETALVDRTAEEAPAAEGEITTLKWALWDWNAIYYYQPLIDEFEKQNPGVKIEAVDLGSGGTSDYVTNLATELSGNGTDFDIATIQSVPQYTTLVEKGVLAPLNDYIAKDGVDTSLYGGLVEQITIDGQVYELPFRSDFWMLYYNPALFEKKGVEPPSNDMTWEQYDAAAPVYSALQSWTGS